MAESSKGAKGGGAGRGGASAASSVGCCSCLPARSSKSRKMELPMEHVGVLSFLTYGWLDGFMWRAFRSGIDEHGMWKCPEVDGAERNGQRLEKMWEEELSTKGRDKASLSAVFIKFIRRRLLLATFILVIAMALLLLSIAYFLLEILKYSYTREHPLWVGLVLVFCFLLVDILQNILFICVFSVTHIAGARLRSGALLLLYRKLLTVSQLKNKTAGQIVNLFANDSQRIFDGVSHAPMLIVAPFLGIATTAYSIYLLGLWPLLGFGVLFFLFPIQMCIGKGIMTFRGRAMPITDRRIRIVGETLANIKFIKMYCWEKPIINDVTEVRAQEKRLLEKVNISTSLMFSVSAIVVAMATIATIMGHTLTGHSLTAVEAFIYIAIFSSIQSKLMLTAIAMKSFSELKVAADRFQEVLLIRDHQNAVSMGAGRKSVISESVIEMCNATLSWDSGSSNSDSSAPTSTSQNGQEDALQTTSNGISKMDATNAELQHLHSETEISPEVLTDVSFSVRQGEVVGVTGPIGSGKSALITAILGQMRIVRGTAKVTGKLAYVPQQAWLFNASIRENILFGKHFDREKYDDVVRLCCLDMDFSILPQGDSTEVGERGVTLSGGQKQRVSLARALYSNRDVYLLDDPFSAVDPDIADTLYQNLIQHALVGKTVVFTTHTAKYLPGCDMLLFLRGGTIVEQGSHDELRDSGGEYYNYYLTLKEHDGETRDVQSHEDGPRISSVEVEVNDNKPALIRRPTRVKPKQIKEEAEKLVRKEEQEAGAVSGKTYAVYTQAAGGAVSVLLVVILFIVAEGSRAFSYWWLAHWLSQGSGNTTIPVEQIIGNETMVVEEISKSIADNPRLGFYNLIYGLTLVGTLIFFIVRALVFAKLSMKASHRLHQCLLGKVLRCPMMFFDTTPLGRIMNRFSKDMDELDSQLPPMVEQTLQTIVSITMYIVMVSIILHWFPIAIPPLLIIFSFVYAIFRVGLRDIKRLQNISMSPLLSHISATVQGIYSLHAYERVPEFTARFVDMLDYNTVTTLLFNCCMRWINLRLSFITSSTACVTALLVVLLPDVVRPEYAGLAIVYSTQLAGLFQFFTRSAAEAEARFTSAERINKYIEDLEPEPPLIVQRYRPHGDWPDKGQVTFKDYQMRYREGLPLVLKGIDCEFKPGERIGIVGHTGSGKSSLASALFRLVEPSGGTVEVDGMDIGQLGLEDLRTHLSAIPQDPVLFAGTVRSNLDPSYRSIDDELWRALEKCNIKHLVLTLEGGLDAPVVEGGENFSAGERQLLCMARVLLRHTRILVLDEATASMDSETDAVIQQALKAAFSDCTQLIIAHRPSTVLTCDRVLVMQKGRIVEFDTPASLRANPESRFNALMSITTHSTDVFTDDASDILASDAWV